MSTRIVIIGAPKTGKSQLAAIIHNALLQNKTQRFEAIVVDEGKDIINEGRQLMEVQPFDKTARVVIEVENSEGDWVAVEAEHRDRMHDLAVAIVTLDPADDDSWTQDGMPAMAKLEELFGRELTREDVERAAPGFRRPIKESVAGLGDGTATDNGATETGMQVCDSGPAAETDGEINIAQSTPDAVAATAASVKETEQQAFAAPTEYLNPVQRLDASLADDSAVVHDEEVEGKDHA